MQNQHLASSYVVRHSYTVTFHACSAHHVLDPCKYLGFRAQADCVRLWGAEEG